jgi:hypothetical protein
MAQFLVMGILTVFICLRVSYVIRQREDPVLGAILIGVAATRLGIGLVNHYLGPLPGAQIDAIMFDQTARNMAGAPSQGINFAIEFGKYGYSSLLALFYSIGGYHFFVPTMVNLVFTLEFVLIVYTIGRDGAGPVAGRIAAACAAFYPTSMIYTSVPLREAPLLWGFALYVQALLAYYDGKSRLFSPRLLIGLVTLVWLHDGFALAVFLIPVAMWFKYREVSVMRRVVFMALGLVVMLTIFVVALSFIDFRKMPADPAMLLDPAFLSRMREVKSAYGVGYGEVDATWGGILLSWPMLVFAFVAAPFPIWWSGMGELPKVAEGMLSLGLVVAACATVLRHFRRTEPRRRMLLSMYLFMVLVFAMGTGNTGIAARHRAKFVWMPITLISMAWCASAESRRERAVAATPPVTHAVAGSGR